MVVLATPQIAASLVATHCRRVSPLGKKEAHTCSGVTRLSAVACFACDIYAASDVRRLQFAHRKAPKHGAAPIHWHWPRVSVRDNSIAIAGREKCNDALLASSDV